MKTVRYSDEVCTCVYIVYLIAIVIWLSVIIYFHLWCTRGSFILLLPLVLFIIGIVNVKKLTVEVEDEMFNATFLTLGLVLALPLFTWLNKDYQGDRDRFAAVIIIALSFSFITMIDIWIPKGWLSVYKHFRSAFQTMSVVLLIFALVNYYLHRSCPSLGI